MWLGSAGNPATPNAVEGLLSPESVLHMGANTWHLPGDDDEDDDQGQPGFLEDRGGRASLRTRQVGLDRTQLSIISLWTTGVNLILNICSFALYTAAFVRSFRDNQFLSTLEQTSIRREVAAMNNFASTMRGWSGSVTRFAKNVAKIEWSVRN